MFGKGAIDGLKDILDRRDGYKVYLIDGYFRDRDILDSLPIEGSDEVIFVDTTVKPQSDIDPTEDF